MSGSETPSPSASDSALAIMRRETRLRFGDVPESVGGFAVGLDEDRVAGDEYLLRTPGFALHYRRGAGITAHLADPEARGDMDLFLAGSVAAAIACINGLYPLHASAVMAGGRALAFTAPSGGGKSTLAAALARRGFPLVCDDTLILDMAASPPLALPGHKRLKLWPDAVALTGVEPMELVSPAYPKYFTRAAGSDVDRALPLGAIIVLAEGGTPAFERLYGAACFSALDAAHYTARLYADARGPGDAGLFAWRAMLARSAPFYRFTRPVTPDRFQTTLDFIAEKLEMLTAS